jgi:hypothetical protein
MEAKIGCGIASFSDGFYGFAEEPADTDASHKVSNKVENSFVSGFETYSGDSHFKSSQHNRIS